MPPSTPTPPQEVFDHPTIQQLKILLGVKSLAIADVKYSKFINNKLPRVSCVLGPVLDTGDPTESIQTPCLRRAPIPPTAGSWAPFIHSFHCAFLRSLIHSAAGNAWGSREGPLRPPDSAVGMAWI